MDVALLLLLELYPLAAMAICPYGKVGGYFIGVCQTALILTVLLIVADVVVRCRTSDERRRAQLLEEQKTVKDVLYLHQMRLIPHLGILDEYAEHARVLEGALTAHAEDDGQGISSDAGCGLDTLEQGAEESAGQNEEPGESDPRLIRWSNTAAKIRAWWEWRPSWWSETASVRTACWAGRDHILALIALVLWSMVCIWMFCMVRPNEPPGEELVRTAAITMFVSVIGLSLAIKKRVGIQAVKATGYSVVVLFIAIMMVVLLWGVTAEEDHKDAKHGDARSEPYPPLMVVPNNTRKEDDPSEWLPTLRNAPEVQPYPVCKQRWGTNLSVLDLAALAALVYDESCSSVTLSLGKVFGKERRASLLNCTDPTDKPRTITVHFPDDKEGTNGKGTTVVAVRGTSNSYDAYMDLDLYAQVQVLQFVDSCILPILHMMPVYLTRVLVNLWNPLRDTRRLAESMRKRLKWKVKDAQTMAEGSKIVMTGHSLGGLFAGVVAAELAVEALTFSAPGNMFLNLSKTTTEPLEKYMNVLPDHDAVPRVDWFIGAAQHVVCRDKHGEHLGPSKCHGMQKTACELWRTCGDAPYHRDFNKSCWEHVDRGYLGKDFPPTRSGFWSFFMT